MTADALPSSDKELRAHFKHVGETGVTLPAPANQGGPRWDAPLFRSAMAQIAQSGLMRFAVPASCGGLDAPWVQRVAVLEGFGEGCRDVSLGFSVAEQFMAIGDTLGHFGTAAQQERWLRPLAEGRIFGAQAITEPEAGSDLSAMSMQATRTENGYTLNGQKTLIGLAEDADVTVVFAVTDPAKGRWGLSAFLVERGDAGFHTSPAKATMGLETARLCDVAFTDCQIPHDRLLGKEGSGWIILQHALIMERAFILATQVGAMARQLREATAFARARKSSGAPIITLQSVSNRLADMALRLKTSQLILRDAAQAADNGETLTNIGAMVKLQVSECFAASSLDAVRIMGGHGYLSENEVERDLRDAVGGLLYGGTSDIQRQIITAMLD